MARFKQIYAGEWDNILGEQQLACCSCGLVHNIEYKFTKDKKQKTSPDIAEKDDYKRKGYCRNALKYETEKTGYFQEINKAPALLAQKRRLGG